MSSGAQQEHGLPLDPSWSLMEEVVPPSSAREAVTDSPGRLKWGPEWWAGILGATGASGETNVSSRV